LSTSIPAGDYTFNFNVYARQETTTVSFDLNINIMYCGYETLTLTTTAATYTYTSYATTSATTYITNTVLCALITHSLSASGKAKYCPVDTFALYDDSTGTTAYSYSTYLNTAS
jgi:hypothetical protein